MADPPIDRVLRAEASSQRATFLELFLDLVFVFALTRVSQRLVADFTTDQRIVFPEAGKTLLLFLALWLVWASTAWVTSAVEPEAFAVQGFVVITMVGSMVLAVALPHGFGERALIFAVAYLAIQLGRMGFFLFATRTWTGRGDRSSPRRVFLWAALTAVPWIVGGLAGENVLRAVLWSVALTVDYLGFTLRWPTLRLGRLSYGAQSSAFGGEHLAERYQQFLLIALGEVILVTGFTFTGGGDSFTLGRTSALGMALLTTVLLWRIYFYRAGHVLPLAIIEAHNPIRLGLSTAYTHLIMIAGIVLTGVGYELTIKHPFDHVVAGWLIPILGGPALFLAGRAGFEFQVFGRVSRPRVAGLVMLAAAVPATPRLPLLAVAGITAAVLLGVALFDLRRARGQGLEQPAPPV